MHGYAFAIGLAAVVGCAFASVLGSLNAATYAQQGINQGVALEQSSARSYSRSEQEEQKEEQKSSISSNVARSAAVAGIGGATVVGTGYNSDYTESSEAKKSSSKSTYETESQQETSKLSAYTGNQAIVGGAQIIGGGIANSGYLGAGAAAIAAERQSQASNSASAKSETKESSSTSSEQSSVAAAQQASLTSAARLVAGKQITASGYAENAFGGTTPVGTGLNGDYKQSSDASKLSAYTGNQGIVGGINVIRGGAVNSDYIGTATAAEKQSQASQQSSATSSQQASLTSASEKKIAGNRYAEGDHGSSKESQKQQSQNAYNSQKDLQASKGAERSSISSNNVSIKGKAQLQQKKKQQVNSENKKGKKCSAKRKEDIGAKQAVEAKAKQAAKARQIADAKLMQKAYAVKQKYEAEQAAAAKKAEQLKRKKEHNYKQRQPYYKQRQPYYTPRQPYYTPRQPYYKPKQSTATLYGKVQAKNCNKGRTSANSYTKNASIDYTKAKQQSSSTIQKSRNKQNAQFDKNKYSNKKNLSNAIGLGKATIGTKLKNRQSSNKKVKSGQTIRILMPNRAQSAGAAKAQNMFTKNNYRSSQGSKIAKSNAKSESIMVQNGARTDAASVAVSRDRGIDANQNIAASTASDGMTEIVIDQEMVAQSRKSRTETSSSSIANSKSGSSSLTATAGNLRTDGVNQAGRYRAVTKSSQNQSSSQTESKQSETFEESSRILASSQVKAKALYGK